MSKIPKYGATPLLYQVEESRGHAWRPLGAGTLDQREALVELDRLTSSYTRRVVQVVAVRMPGAWLSLPVPIACAMLECEAPAIPGSRYCSIHDRQWWGMPADPTLSVGGAIREEIDRLRAIVQEHVATARHREDCPAAALVGSCGEGASCTCGLADLLAASAVFLEQTTPKDRPASAPGQTGVVGSRAFGPPAGEYGPDRYAGEDFARPRGVTP